MGYFNLDAKEDLLMGVTFKLRVQGANHEELQGLYSRQMEELVQRSKGRNEFITLKEEKKSLCLPCNWPGEHN